MDASGKTCPVAFREWNMMDHWWVNLSDFPLILSKMLLSKIFCKWMIGRRLSFWEGAFSGAVLAISGAMLVLGRVLLMEETLYRLI